MMINVIQAAILGLFASLASMPGMGGSAIEDKDGYQIVAEVECEGQLEKSMPLVVDIMEQGYQFDVVMALNDPAALGAIAALQQMEILDQVLVYGVDGTPEAKILVHDGFMQATVAQYPKTMGKRAAAVAYQLLAGNKSYDDEKIRVEIINQENVDQYSLEDWQ